MSTKMNANKLLKICVAFCIVVHSVPYTSGCAEWNVLTKPVIFGKTVKLACTVHNVTVTTNSSAVTWIGGPNETTLSFNGISSGKPGKYKVTNLQNGTKFISTLEIANFSENDVNFHYSCLVGFQENRKELKLTEENFVLFPTTTDITVFSTLRKGHLDVKYEIRRVYPIPSCTVILGKKVITKKTESHVNGVNGIFYKIKETVYYDFGNSVCSGKMTISCEIGSEKRNIHKEHLDSCPDLRRRTTEYVALTKSEGFLATTIVIIFLILILVVAFAGIARYGNIGDLICCNVNLRGEEKTAKDIPLALKPFMPNGNDEEMFNTEEQQDT